jgi:protein gp37
VSALTGIEWTDRTWNPVTGCTKVSPGCAHCYAEGVAMRFWASQYPPIEYDTYSVDACCPITEMRSREFTDVQTHEDRLLEPLSWRKPARVFVNSMSDLFHEDVPHAFINSVFNVMIAAGRHTFQILTKRPERMRAYMAERFDDAPVNVWLGVSVENQHFLQRIDVLKDTPAAVRFVSFEPLLEDLGAVILDRINWAIIGGESGRGARPFDIAWARSLVRQCKAQRVACFVKQLGANPEFGEGCGDCDPCIAGQRCPYANVQLRMGLKSRKGGDPEEWPIDLRVREFPPADDAVREEPR